MRVCLLTDEVIEDFDPSIYLKNHEWDMMTVEPPVFEFIREVSARDPYDVYLNIFEGFEEDDTSGFDLVAALEELNLPFTGADKNFYSLTREQMQAGAELNGIPFARRFHARHEDDLAQAKTLQFPLIVKHPNSFASIGLTRGRASTRCGNCTNNLRAYRPNTAQREWRSLSREGRSVV